ncbi:MAG: hypothetical protein H0V29_07905 [Thermoleophilaceae bacterium]|nr:hypothetical protein [Thermoleophilaceae bacterium]
MDATIAMARRAAAEGITVIAATPHVNSEYDPAPERIAELVDETNRALGEEDVALRVEAGAEVAITRAAEMQAQQLRRLSLGGNGWVLLESPYQHAVPFVEDAVFALQLAGSRILLAHPERAPAFQRSPERLEALVERGVACAVNATSLSGAGGSSARDLGLRLVHARLAHVICSDSHDDARRPPALEPGIAAAELSPEETDWFTEGAPAAVLAGTDLPPRPVPLPQPPRRGLFRRR